MRFKTRKWFNMYTLSSILSESGNTYIGVKGSQHLSTLVKGGHVTCWHQSAAQFSFRLFENITMLHN